MSNLEQAFHRAVSDLTQLNCRWALVGGLAVSVRSEPRFTRDIDFAVVVERDQDAENLASQLQGRGYTPVRGFARGRDLQALLRELLPRQQG